MTNVQPAEAFTVEEARVLQQNLREPLRPGLTPAELSDVEDQFGFTFSDDHRIFLTAGVPVGDRWPDWRHGDPDQLRKRLDWPVDGVLYDVENNDLWLAEWGPRPRSMCNALAVARRHLATVPQLVPVCGHRYLPATPGESGYPVLSVYQTDVVYYGWDLRSYLRHEFGGEPLGEEPANLKTVEFWSRFVE